MSRSIIIRHGNADFSDIAIAYGDESVHISTVHHPKHEKGYAVSLRII